MWYSRKFTYTNGPMVSILTILVILAKKVSDLDDYVYIDKIVKSQYV